ncbi:MAG: hypothetical protein ACPGSK_08005 [Alphaproteobacteria bacterium]
MKLVQPKAIVTLGTIATQVLRFSCVASSVLTSVTPWNRMRLIPLSNRRPSTVKGISRPA